MYVSGIQTGSHATSAASGHHRHEGLTVIQHGDDQTTGTGLLVKDAMVSHYRIASKIGSGGMGEVYLADDTKLNRRVALKFLPSHLAADTILRARFTREVQAVAALNHPNIVHVYEVSEFNRRPFFAMEYVEGDPLRERMRSGKMPLEEALRYIIGLCEGLEAAHKVGIVHRDIKPANIVIAASGRVKILDFGLAKRASDPTLTSMGSTLGTICYMSPEQVQGKESDNRSDLFSVGIVLYEMIAGRLPFRGDYDAATLTAIVSEPHEPLVKFRPDAPPHLSAIVDRLLAKEPLGRYQSVTDLLVDLNQLRDELKYGSRQTARPDKPPRRFPMGAAVAGIVIVAAAAVAAVLLLRGTEPTVVQNEPAQEIGTEVVPPAPLSTETDKAPPPQPVVDRSAYIAESTATAAESERLRALRDSMEMERARLAASVIPAQDTTPAVERHSQPIAAAGAAPEPLPSSRNPHQAKDRAADSIAIAETVARFWQTLEHGRVNDLRNEYPGMPKDWESTWKTFVDFAKDLDIASSVGTLRFENSDAEATNSIRMTFRDRSGSKSEDVRYSIRLTHRDGQWVIADMERNH